MFSVQYSSKWTEEYINVMYLQEAYCHQYKAVRADASCKNFIQIPLQQELLQDEDQRWENSVFLRTGRTMSGLNQTDG